MIDRKQMQRIFGGLLLVSLFAMSQWANAARLNDVRVWHAPDRTRVVMDLDEVPVFKRFYLTNPSRYVVDLHGFSLNAIAPEKAKQGGYIKGIRLGVPKKNVARLVMDLNQEVNIETLVLKPVKGYKHRLVFDVSPKNKQQESAANSAKQQDKGSQPGTKKTKPANSANQTGVTTAKVAPTQQAPEKPAPTKKPDAPFIIAIDAGHGGEDTGARGRRTNEKDIVLQIAKRLKKKIDAQKGMRAVLTRTGDYFIKLSKRTQLAQEANADLFISIHADGFRNIKARGSSVYALSLRGASSAEAKALADSENASDLLGGVKLASLDDDLAKTIVNLQMNSTQHESITFADSVLTQFKKIGKVHKNSVEKAGFVVLKTPDIPSILVETAFITNPNEEKLLRSAAHQEKLSNAILLGIINYLKNSNYHSVRFNQ